MGRRKLIFDVEKSCLHCGKKLVLKITRDIKEKKFCNRSCHSKHFPFTNWSHEEEEFLIKNYRLFTNLELSKKLGRTKGSIVAKIFKLSLKRTKDEKNRVLTRVYSSNHRNPKRPWTENEIDVLKSRHPDTHNRDLALLFGRSIKSIGLMAHRFKLRKSDSFMRNTISKSLLVSQNDEEIKRKMLRNSRKSMGLRPNKPETALINIIKENNLPFNYVGDGSIWFKGENHLFNPDFLSKNPKHIIEVYGDYWHNLPKTKKRDLERIDAYSKYGYKTLIIWEHELKNPPDVLEKIRRFIPYG